MRTPVCTSCFANSTLKINGLVNIRVSVVFYRSNNISPSFRSNKEVHKVMFYLQMTLNFAIAVGLLYESNNLENIRNKYYFLIQICLCFLINASLSISIYCIVINTSYIISETWLLSFFTCTLAKVVVNLNCTLCRFNVEILGALLYFLQRTWYLYSVTYSRNCWVTRLTLIYIQSYITLTGIAVTFAEYCIL